MSYICVLSHIQANKLVDAREKNEKHVDVSLDLGLSTASVELSTSGVIFPDQNQVDWESIEYIVRKENKCFVISKDQVEEIRKFSDLTNRVYSLYPTQGPPTMLISGIPMHRIKDTDPQKDTLEKIKSIKPIFGRVLDTATGLGYTAIEAAKYSEQVVTIELDQVALDIARLNPWSRELFQRRNIVQIIGDSFDEIKLMDRESFSRIIHDPPAFSLAGDLYSEEFYRELYRVLQQKGRLFHYIGNPNSKSGNNITNGVVKRLKMVGFKKIVPEEKAFGVRATK